MKRIYIISLFFALSISLCYQNLSTCPVLRQEMSAQSTCYMNCHAIINPLTGDTTYIMIDSTNLGIDTITVSNTGIQNVFLSAGLQVYPTVTCDVVYISTRIATDALTYRVYTLDGRMMTEGVLPSGAAMTGVSLGRFPTGSYIIRVSEGTTGASFRIAKL